MAVRTGKDMAVRTGKGGRGNRLKGKLQTKTDKQQENKDYKTDLFLKKICFAIHFSDFQQTD